MDEAKFPYMYHSDFEKMRHEDPFKLTEEEAAWVDGYMGEPNGRVPQLFNTMADFFSNGSNAGTPGQYGYDGDNKSLLLCLCQQNERIALMLDHLKERIEHIHRDLAARQDGKIFLGGLEESG